MSSKARFIAISIINSAIFVLLFVLSVLAGYSYVPLNSSLTVVGMLSVVAHSFLFYVYDLWRDTESLTLKIVKILLLAIVGACFLFTALLMLLNLITLDGNFNVFLLPLEILWPIAIISSFLIYRFKENDLLSILALPISIVISYVLCLPLCCISRFIPSQGLRFVLIIAYFTLLVTLRKGAIFKFFGIVIDAVFSSFDGYSSDVVFESNRGSKNGGYKENSHNDSKVEENLHNDYKVREEIDYEVSRWKNSIFSGKTLNIYSYCDARVKVEWVCPPHVRTDYGSVCVENGSIKITLLSPCRYSTDSLESQIVSSITDDVADFVQSAIKSCKYYTSYRYTVRVNISFRLEYDY